MTVVEQEINRGILLFAKENNINLSDKEMIDIKEKTTRRRRIVLHKETFLLTCDCLSVHDIINFITTCKEFMKYYPFIWNNIQKKLFPYSIFISSDYKLIRYKIVVDYWYSAKCKNNNVEYNNYFNQHYYDIFADIIYDDNIIEKRYGDIKKTNNHKINRTHNAEIVCTKRTRINCINKLSDNYIDMLKTFRYYCENDPSGDKYATIKSDVDMCLYGLNPSCEEDMDEWTNVGIKWITGEYTTNKIYICVNEYNTDDDFEYGIDYDSYFKIRILPQYFC
jgi:hypothetical protein